MAPHWYDIVLQHDFTLISSMLSQAGHQDDVQGEKMGEVPVHDRLRASAGPGKGPCLWPLTAFPSLTFANIET